MSKYPVLVSTCFFIFIAEPLARSAVIIPKPTTCTAINNQHEISRNGYNSLYDSTNKPYLAFCDFQSDPGFVWTLIESLSLAYAQSSTFRESFEYNIPSNECTPNWSNYRLSKARMTAIQNAALFTHFRVTCNFNGDSDKGLQDRRDYLRVSLCAYGYLLSTKSVWTCATVDYINVRGISCSKCSIPFISGSGTHLMIDLPCASMNCGRFNAPNRANGEHIFGNYWHISQQFSCAANRKSTTNWWIGGAYFDYL